MGYPTDENISPYGRNHPASDDRPEPDIREEIFEESQEGEEKEPHPKTEDKQP